MGLDTYQHLVLCSSSNEDRFLHTKHIYHILYLNSMAGKGEEGCRNVRVNIHISSFSFCVWKFCQFFVKIEEKSACNTEICPSQSSSQISYFSRFIIHKPTNLVGYGWIIIIIWFFFFLESFTRQEAISSFFLMHQKSHGAAHWVNYMRTHNYVRTQVLAYKQ